MFEHLLKKQTKMNYAFIMTSCLCTFLIDVLHFFSHLGGKCSILLLISFHANFMLLYF